MEDIPRLVVSIWSRLISSVPHKRSMLDSQNVSHRDGETEGGNLMPSERLAAVEGKMRLVLASVLEHIDRGTNQLKQVSDNTGSILDVTLQVQRPSIAPTSRETTALPVAVAEQALSTVSTPAAPFVGLGNMAEGKFTRTSSALGGKTWNVGEVEEWLRTRPPAEAVARWLASRPGLEGLVEACRARPAEGLGILALLRPEELPPASSGRILLRNLSGLPTRSTAAQDAATITGTRIPAAEGQEEEMLLRRETDHNA